MLPSLGKRATFRAAVQKHFGSFLVNFQIVFESSLDHFQIVFFVVSVIVVVFSPPPAQVNQNISKALLEQYLFFPLGRSKVLGAAV